MTSQQPTDGRETISQESAQLINSRLKDVRSRILRELYYNDGEAPVSQLTSESGANVPRGSLKMHLAWLRGERRNGTPRDWWPDDVGALATVDRYEDRGHGNKTRIIALTDTGRELMKMHEDGLVISPAASIDELRNAIMGQKSQIRTLTDEVEENTQQIGDIEERISDIEMNMHHLLTYLETIHGHVENLQNEIGSGQEGDQ